MNKSATPPNHERYCYKVIFPVFGHLAMIHALSKKGVYIKTDDNLRFACACFDNSIDYNSFKQKIDYFSIA